ncbi:MAG TPA: tetratricopeptide repeat protein [Burkholderiales bacterium]|nr:tetratricopeptide repeat protein [Burkholderiales bacterium]
MANSLVANLEQVLAAGRDDALLRFSLGTEYLKLKQATAAVAHLRQAVRHDPTYSAAWKLLGNALAECGRLQQALTAFQQGITVAEAKGDKQAAREMQVFARRIEKQLAQNSKSGQQQ